MTIKWMGCAPTNCRKGRPPGLEPTAIVLHLKGGSLSGTDARFNNPASFVSAHYGIGANGDVHCYVPEQDTAFHAGIVVNPTWPGLRKGVNPNFYTIGIEYEGGARNLRAEGDSQLDASAALIAGIGSRWNIPIDLNHVITHSSIRASKACQGEDAIIEQILRRIKPVDTASALAVPAVTQVQTLRDTNLRFQSASTSARVVRVIPARTSLTVGGYTDSGERIRNNAFWYRDPSGNYLWAGATDVPHPA